MDKNPIWERDGFIIRLAKVEDLKDYYEQNYCPLDKELVCCIVDI